MTHALILAALLSSAVPGAQDAADAALLVPKEAFLTVRVESAERLHALAARFAGMGGDEGPADAAALLADMDLPGDAAQIDLARPAFVAFSLGGMAPLPTFVVPTRDAQAFVASLATDAGIVSAISGSYVGVSQQPAYAAASEANAMLAALRPGLISARLDLATLIKTYRPMIEMGLEQVETMMDQMTVQQDAPMDMSALMEIYVDALWDFVDSADQLDLAFEYDGELLRQHVWLTTLAESPMAKLGGEGSYDLRPAAGCVDPQASLNVLMACDMAKTMERMQPWLDMALAAYPPELGSELKRFMDSYAPVLPLLGTSFAASGDLGQGGLRLAYDVPCPDPAKLSEAIRAQLASLSAGESSQTFAIAPPEEVELAGGRALRSRLTFDITKVTEEWLAESMQDEAELGQLQQMLAGIYGDGALQWVWRPLSDRLVMALGGDEAFAAATLNAKPRSLESQPAELRAAVEAASGGALGLVYRIDYARLFSDMAPLFTEMGIDEFAGLSEQGLRMPITFWMKIAGTTWSGGAGVRMDQIEALAKAIREAEAAHSGAGSEEDR